MMPKKYSLNLDQLHPVLSTFKQILPNDANEIQFEFRSIASCFGR